MSSTRVRVLLDASALVVVHARESGSFDFQQFYATRETLWTTDVCLVESLGVLKRHWQRKGMSLHEYVIACRQLLYDTSLGKVHLLKSHLQTVQFLSQVEEIVKTHNLDFVDAMQLFSLTYEENWIGSKDQILVTTDGDLASAAKVRGVRVWNCRLEPQPTDA